VEKDTSIRKAFVRNDGHILIMCPKCGLSKDLAIGQLRGRQRLLKIRCKCGDSFRLELEFRQSFRKSTNLEGVCIFDQNEFTSKWEVKVVNLSLGGACIEILGTHSLQVGDKGSLRFKLDNRKESIIVKLVIVRTVSGNKIGCQFAADRVYEKDLGFYLRP